MPAKRISMRKIREVLRQRWESKLTFRQIGRGCSISPGTAMDYERRARAAKLTWTKVEEMDDQKLEELLFPLPPSSSSEQQPVLPDWSEIHRERKRKGVTLVLLWQEYKARFPEGVQYSRFCDMYREWRGQLEVCMRQEHRAGEKTFVDYCGQTANIVDRQTGEVREAQVFVAVLGASNYTYAEASWSQGLEDWISSHCRAFEFFGGVSELVVPDNLKSGVQKACRYEPDLNPTYNEMAKHYSTVIIPARVRKPRDKAKVEQGVLQTERWILAVLRNQTFFSLDELNSAIRRSLNKLNSKPLKKLKVSRMELFKKLDQPALKSMPKQRYEYAEWKKAKVAPDYHVEVDRHYYSVPYQLIKKEIDIRASASIIECFFKNKRVAAHSRNRRKGGHTTIPEHMPKPHQEYLEWTPQRLINWADKIGGFTSAVVNAVMSSRPHPQQGFRSCLGILRLGKRYGKDRLEAACERAMTIKSASYKSVKSILENNLDQQPLLIPPPQAPVIRHDNIRGPEYFK